MWPCNSLHYDDNVIISSQPKLDSQESIYADLLTRITTAENLLTEADAEGMNNTGAQDLLYGTPTLSEIMVQKYLAQTSDEQVQTYNDLRRCKALGETFVKMKNPNNLQGGMNQWPPRLPYGNSDVVSNPNVAAAFGTGNDAGNYIFTENVWLFGGSR